MDDMPAYVPQNDVTLSLAKEANPHWLRKFAFINFSDSIREC